MNKRKLIFTILTLTSLLFVALAGCKSCDKNKNKEHVHDFGELVVGIEKTCETDGTLSYYECKTCGKKYDVTKTIELTDLTIKKGHEIVSTKAETPATCLSDGNYAYSYCSACNKYLSSDGKELKTVVIPKLPHDFTNGRHEAVEATCEADGHDEYYECRTCNQYFAGETDEYGTKWEYLVRPKTNHVNKTYVNETAPSCADGTNGVKAHFHCGACNKDFDLKGNVVTPENLVIPATHIMVYHAKIECGCETDGVKEYSHCTVCGRNYADAAGTTLLTDLTIPKKGHSFYTNGALDESKFTPEKPATETKKGWVAHYHCDDCGLNFDADGNKLNDVYLIFGHTLKWVEERPMNCSGGIEGRKGHYECIDDGCYKLFDINGNETDLDELTIPVTHVFGDIIAAHDGDCQNKAALQDYYVCKVCNLFFDENGNRIAGIDLFGGLGDHVCEYVYENENYHKKICTVCGNEQGLFGHSGRAIYSVNANGEKVKKIECEHCGYVTPESTYFSPTDAAVQPVIVGLNDNNNVIVEFAGEKESRSVELADVIDENTKKELNAFISAFVADKTKKTTEKEITVVYEDFTKTLEIGFIKVDYEFDKPYALDSRYDVNAIDSLNDISYVTYRATGALHYYGIVVISDEDAQRFAAVKAELAKTGGEREFTYTFSYTGAESDPTYSVTITLYADMPAYVVGFRVENEVLRGNRPRIATLTYNDYTTKNVLADNLYPDEDYFFDANKSGIQSGAFVYRGLIASSVVVVRDENDVKEISFANREIELGKEGYLIVKYYGGHVRVVPLTQDMVKSGRLDLTKAGLYDEITFAYGGKECYVWRVVVKDSTDRSPERIYPNESSVFWKVDENGDVIADANGLEMRVYLKNGDSVKEKVTKDMLSFDKDEAKAAVQSGEGFSATITYLGLTCQINVFALNEETFEIQYVYVDSLYFKDNQIGETYVEAKDKNYVVRYEKLTADMLYNATKVDDGTGEEKWTKTTPFDLAGAEKGVYDLIVAYKGYESHEQAYVYSAEDVKSMLMCMDNDYVIKGDKDSVLNAVKDTEIYYSAYVDFGDEKIGVENAEATLSSATILVPDGTDFGKAGTITLTVTFKDATTKYRIRLIDDPALSGAETYYTVDGSDVNKIVIYNNGYYIINDKYGEHIKDEPNGVVGLLSLEVFGEGYKFYSIDKTNKILTEFKASDLGVDPFKTLTMTDDLDSETYEYAFYTANGKTYADAYRIDGTSKRYGKTYLAEFEDDGKHVRIIEDGKYEIYDGDKMRRIMEGNTVYTYVMMENEIGKKMLCFNDNGKAYGVIVMVGEDGVETQSVVSGETLWYEEGNIVTVKMMGVDIMTFEVVMKDGKPTLVKKSSIV